MSAMQHPLPEDLELYVLGALDTDTAGRLERHVGGCDRCAAALAEEARLETTLRALVPAVGRAPAKVVRLPTRPTPAPAPAAPARTGLSGPLVAAAAILVAVWGLRPSHRAPLPMASDAALICEAEREAPLCPWPGPLASVARASVEENVCRAPADASCALQSRLR